MFLGVMCTTRDDLEDDDEKVSIDLTRLQPKPKEVAIFTSTFNLGECDVEVGFRHLAVWTSM